jgi:hypothetical protein
MSVRLQSNAEPSRGRRTRGADETRERRISLTRRKLKARRLSGLAKS